MKTKKSIAAGTGRGQDRLCCSARGRPHGLVLCYGQKGSLSMALTTKIREYREAQGLKQSDLADLVGVRRETIVNLERGRYNPSLKLAMDIAKVFHTTE